MTNKHSVKDDGDPRKYYAAIPNIVFKIGLNPFEIALYVHLKQIAGEDGTCWKSTATLAKETSMGAGTISKVKALLAAPRPELGNKALITVTAEMQNGGKANHSITITDIWPENMGELARVRLAKATRSRPEVAPSADEGARSPDEHTPSRGGDKEEPLKKNPEEDKWDFISRLRSDPFYSHIDFDYQIGLMQRWLARPENKGRRMTERFVLNWIAKIDRPVELHANSNGNKPDRAAWEAEQKRKHGWDKFERQSA